MESAAESAMGMVRETGRKKMQRQRGAQVTRIKGGALVSFSCGGRGFPRGGGLLRFGRCLLPLLGHASSSLSCSGGVGVHNKARWISDVGWSLVDETKGPDSFVGLDDELASWDLELGG